MNETMKNILERRSIRKYKPDMVKKKLLDQVIEAGLYAATGHGKQSSVIIAVPGSGNPQHIAENAAIFDFTLSDDDMQQMRTLNMSRRFENLVPCNPMTQIPC